MRRKATILTCDICGETNIIALDDDGQVQHTDWKELHLGDPGSLYNCPKPNDICPVCANKVMTFIDKLKGETI